MFTIHGIELEFDSFESETVGKYEDALKKVQKTDTIMKQGISLKSKIVNCCKVIYEAIDDIFGEGTAVKMFGENNYNIREASGAWHEIITEINRQASEEATLFLETMNQE